MLLALACGGVIRGDPWEHRSNARAYGRNRQNCSLFSRDLGQAALLLLGTGYHLSGVEHAAVVLQTRLWHSRCATHDTRTGTTVAATLLSHLHAFTLAAHQLCPQSLACIDSTCLCKPELPALVSLHVFEGLAWLYTGFVLFCYTLAGGCGVVVVVAGAPG